jgi:lipopolysaccharide export system permease protein
MVLSRYVLREHVAPFLFSFAVIIFLLMVNMILFTLDQVLGKGIPLLVAGELFFLNLAWMVALAVPMSVLVSTLMAFGRLSSDGEITAMRALGVNISRVARPVVIAGSFLALLMLWFNDQVLPEFNHRARVLAMDIARKRPSVVFADLAGVVVDDFPDYRIMFDRVDKQGRMMENVKVYQFLGDPYPATILADSGQVIFDRVSNRAFLNLLNGSLIRVDDQDPEVQIRTQFKWAQLRLGDAGQSLSRSSSDYRNDREMGIGMMRARIAQNGIEVGQSYADLSATTAVFFEHLLLWPQTETFDGSAFLSLLGRTQSNARIADHKNRESDRLRVEVHKKFSIPAACIAFVLVGMPLGIRVRGRSPAIGASLSIGFFLMWWIFLIAGEKLADRGILEPWLAMWAPNMVTFLLGGWLTARVILNRQKGQKT